VDLRRSFPALLRLDGDMYESTVDVLHHAYDKLSIGGNDTAQGRSICTPVHITVLTVGYYFNSFPTDRVCCDG
jgi:hypothetical protein